ncbi:MAG TPA: hypothetical protein DD643_05800 [Synechococcus sp. UBA8638]|nr:hypothetical protein [Synechococcus sp. UBA8638]
MDISNIRSLLSTRMAAGFDCYERRPGHYQLIVPITHEDGDMVDIYLQNSPLGESYVRICDCAMTLMRLSYSYDLTTSTRRRIFHDILVNNRIECEEGNLYIDTSTDMLYEGIMQFAGCIQKVCNMRYWTRETVRSAFYEDLNEYIQTKLTLFSPISNQSPLPNDGLYSVDWTLTHNKRNFYLFGVRGNNKAKSVAIILLELQKVDLPFISLIVHEAMEDLGRKERQYLTRNADRQYPVLMDFKESGLADLKRLAPRL